MANEETFPSKAIILDRFHHKDFDSRIIAYSPSHGRLELIARGTRRLKSKLAGHVEPLSLSDIMVVRGRHFDYVGSARMSESFSGLKSDYNRLLVAGRATRLAKKLLLMGEADRSVYELLYVFFSSLDREPDGPRGQALYLAFVIALLSLLGYQPEVEDCVCCGRAMDDSDAYFDCALGGAICPACGRGRPGLLIMAGSGRDFFSAAISGHLSLALTIEGGDNDEIEKILRAYLRYNLELEI
jgi:DNA repair protein RecO (recombination protein O)